LKEAGIRQSRNSFAERRKKEGEKAGVHFPYDADTACPMQGWCCG